MKIAPALIALKVPEYAAHMFIFYYAVLSEVSSTITWGMRPSSAQVTHDFRTRRTVSNMRPSSQTLLTCS